MDLASAIIKGSQILVVAMPVKVPSTSKSQDSEGLSLLVSRVPRLKCPPSKGHLDVSQ